MIILLCTLLAIALIFTIAGVFLSPRFSESDRRVVSAVRGGAVRGVYSGNMRGPRRAQGYGSEIPTRRAGGRRVYTEDVHRPRQMRRRHSAIGMEQRAWANLRSSLNVIRLFQPHYVGQTPWLGIVLILVTLFVFGLYAFSMVLPGTALMGVASWVGVSQKLAATPSSSDSSILLPAHASNALMRLSQVDPAEYISIDEYSTWWPSACSAASMTEVINSYGHHYHISDILHVESTIGEITPDQGLLRSVGIDHTVARFGFKTRWLNSPSLNDIVSIANKGYPIIVDFPPDKWAGGHILVVRGGNAQYVYLADSSRLNMQAMARDKFMSYWAGFGVVVTPNSMQVSF